MTTIREQLDTLDDGDTNMLTEVMQIIFGAMSCWPDTRVERMLAMIAVNAGGFLGPVLQAEGPARINDLLEQFAQIAREQAAMTHWMMKP